MRMIQEISLDGMTKPLEALHDGLSATSVGDDRLWLLFVDGSCGKRPGKDPRGDEGHFPTVEDPGLAVLIGGEPFTFLNLGPEWAKPFLSPVRAADGTVVTRVIGDTEDKDHPHHKGIWFSVDEVNGIKFWAEAGKILNVKVEVVEGDPARIKLKNHWLGADELPIVVETTTISIFSSRLIVYDATFSAGVDKVTFGDTKEGLFGIRVAPTMREKVGGVVVNAEGGNTGPRNAGASRPNGSITPDRLTASSTAWRSWTIRRTFVRPAFTCAITDCFRSARSAKGPIRTTMQNHSRSHWTEERHCSCGMASSFTWATPRPERLPMPTSSF